MFIQLILLLLIFNICACTSPDSHRSFRDCYSTETTDETCNVFKLLADAVLNIDYEMKKYCSYESITAIERFDQNGYTRKIIFAGYRKDTISIIIKHRVMYTTIDHLYKDRTGLEDIKLLPFNLNTTEAISEIKNDALFINIPYLNDFMEFCQDKINEEVIIVPIFDNDVTRDFDSVTFNLDNINDNNYNTPNNNVNTPDNGNIPDYNDNTTDDKDSTTDGNDNTPDDNDNTPDDNINTPDDQENISDDHENTPDNQENIPDDQENAPDDQENVPDNHYNTPDDNDNTTDGNLPYYDIDIRHSVA